MKSAMLICVLLGVGLLAATANANGEFCEGSTAPQYECGSQSTTSQPVRVCAELDCQCPQNKNETKPEVPFSFCFEGPTGPVCKQSVGECPSPCTSNGQIECRPETPFPGACRATETDCVCSNEKPYKCGDVSTGPACVHELPCPHACALNGKAKCAGSDRCEDPDNPESCDCPEGEVSCPPPNGTGDRECKTECTTVPDPCPPEKAQRCASSTPAAAQCRNSTSECQCLDQAHVICGFDANVVICDAPAQCCARIGKKSCPNVAGCVASNADCDCVSANDGTTAHLSHKCTSGAKNGQCVANQGDCDVSGNGACGDLFNCGKDANQEVVCAETQSGCKARLCAANNLVFCHGLFEQIRDTTGAFVNATTPGYCRESQQACECLKDTKTKRCPNSLVCVEEYSQCGSTGSTDQCATNEVFCGTLPAQNGTTSVNVCKPKTSSCDNPSCLCAGFECSLSGLHTCDRDGEKFCAASAEECSRQFCVKQGKFFCAQENKCVYSFDNCSGVNPTNPCPFSNKACLVNGQYHCTNSTSCFNDPNACSNGTVPSAVFDPVRNSTTVACCPRKECELLCADGKIAKSYNDALGCFDYCRCEDASGTGDPNACPTGTLRCSVFADLASNATSNNVTVVSHCLSPNACDRLKCANSGQFYCPSGACLPRYVDCFSGNNNQTNGNSTQCPTAFVPCFDADGAQNGCAPSAAACPRACDLFEILCPTTGSCVKSNDTCATTGCAGNRSRCSNGLCPGVNGCSNCDADFVSQLRQRCDGVFTQCNSVVGADSANVTTADCMCGFRCIKQNATCPACPNSACSDGAVAIVTSMGGQCGCKCVQQGECPLEYWEKLARECTVVEDETAYCKIRCKRPCESVTCRENAHCVGAGQCVCKATFFGVNGRNCTQAQQQCTDGETTDGHAFKCCQFGTTNSTMNCKCEEDGFIFQRSGGERKCIKRDTKPVEEECEPLYAGAVYLGKKCTYIHDNGATIKFHCVTGFTGVNCEQSFVDSCDNKCSDNQRCSSGTCRCLLAGQNCGNSTHTDNEERKCHNECGGETKGKCVEGVCYCRTGFQGIDCQSAVKPIKAEVCNIKLDELDARFKELLANQGIYNANLTYVTEKLTDDGCFTATIDASSLSADQSDQFIDSAMSIGDVFSVQELDLTLQDAGPEVPIEDSSAATIMASSILVLASALALLV